MDVSPYSAYAGEMTGQWATTATSSASKDDPNFGIRKHRTNIPYRLMSVIEHRGNAYAGHYVTYRSVESTTTEMNTKGTGISSARKNEDWVVVSDEKVSFLSFQDVQRCQAYMLFYEAI